MLTFEVGAVMHLFQRFMLQLYRASGGVASPKVAFCWRANRADSPGKDDGLIAGRCWLLGRAKTVADIRQRLMCAHPFRMRKRLVSAGLSNYGAEEETMLVVQPGEIDFLRVVGALSADGGLAVGESDGAGSPKIRLDLVEFELRHLRVHRPVALRIACSSAF